MSFDSQFTITCPDCGGEYPVDDWAKTAISGPLPAGRFQCPGPTCNYAFSRQFNRGAKSWEEAVKIVREDRVL